MSNTEDEVIALVLLLLSFLLWEAVVASLESALLAFDPARAWYDLLRVLEGALLLVL